MNNRRYEGFTLIEMLVVMGILIILMVVGIAAGRFALFRASDVAHRNAADQIFEGLQAYYVDNRGYPEIESCGDDGESTCNPGNLMIDGPLSPYLDIGAFNGGSGATFIYFVGGDNDDQAALVCVSMRGTKDVNDEATNGAYYCSGNAFSVGRLKTGGTSDFPADDAYSAGVDRVLIERDDDDGLWTDFADLDEDNMCDWDNQEWECVDYEAPAT